MRHRARYAVPIRSGSMIAHLLICLDPGARGTARRCGVSVWSVSPFNPRGTLLGAGHIPVRQVFDFVEATAEAAGLGPGWPQAYLVEAPHLRGNAHAQRSGVEALRRVLDLLKATRPAGSTWREVRPGPWKGNVPKKIHHGRVAAALDPSEIARLPANVLTPGAKGYQHDTADGVGLGAWALGRTGRGGTRTQR